MCEREREREIERDRERERERERARARAREREREREREKEKECVRERERERARERESKRERERERVVPVAWMKMQPSTEVRVLSASSRTPRHGSGIDLFKTGRVTKRTSFRTLPDGRPHFVVQVGRVGKTRHLNKARGQPPPRRAPRATAPASICPRHHFKTGRVPKSPEKDTYPYTPGRAPAFRGTDWMRV